MVANVKKSGLAARLGQEGVKAWEQHKDDAPPVDSGATLPADIEDGVACVRECIISQYSKGDLKGKDFLSIVAIVVSPETFTDANGVIHRIAGRRIQKGPIPLCQSNSWEKDAAGKPLKISFADNYAKMMENMKLIGVGVTNPEVLMPENLEATCQAIEEVGKTDDAIHISFRTWIGKKTAEYPNPKVNVVWIGPVAHVAAPDNTVNDSGTDTGSSTESATGSETTDTTETTTTELTDGESDLEALLQACLADDANAKQQMADIAMGLGITQQEIEDAESWNDIVALIQSKSSESEWVPSVSQMVRYKPIDGKTGKPKSRSVNVEVKKVNTADKTVDLLNMTDKKTVYTAVAWSELEHD